MSWLRLSLFISYKPTRLEYVTWFGNVHQICLAKICLSCHCSFLLYRSLIYDSDLCLSLYNVQCTNRHRVGMQWIICHASLRKIHKNYLKMVRSPCDWRRKREECDGNTKATHCETVKFIQFLWRNSEHMQSRAE